MRSFLLLLPLLLVFSCTPTSNNKATAEETLPEDTLVTHRISLIFAGDLMQHEAQMKAARTAKGTYDYSGSFDYVKEEISKADIAFGNLEVTLGGKPYKAYPQFSAPDEYLGAIKDAGFDVLTTANNHCLDRYQRGLERTIMFLDSLRIPYFGTYVNAEERKRLYPLLLEKNGFRISMLTYTYDTNGIEVQAPNIVNYIDKEVMAKDIEDAKAQNPDLIIAFMHWGYEYKSLPNDEQKHLADWLIEQGVDHVIGGHPHVVQPLELRTDTVTGKQHVVVYSLGNFISNMRARRTDGGIMFKMDLSKDSVLRLDNCGYSLVWAGKPQLVKKRVHTLIPADFPQDSLPQEARKQMKVFVDDARALFKKHNKGIDEYTFWQKN